MRSVLLLVALFAAFASARTLADADATNVLAADSRIAAVMTDTTAVAANSMARTNQRSQAVARQQVQPEGKDGGATTLIANKNYMSLMEDQDGNPLPPDASQESSGSSEGSTPASSASFRSTSSGSSASGSGSASSGSSAPASGSGSSSLSASESARSETSEASKSASESSKSASESVTVQAVTESATVQSATESAKPRFRSLHQRIFRNQAEEQRSIEAASQQNAIAEVAEAMEGAQKVNTRNSELPARRR